MSEEVADEIKFNLPKYLCQKHGSISMDGALFIRNNLMGELMFCLTCWAEHLIKDGICLVTVDKS